MCSICRSTDQVVHECPYFLYSVNVEPVASQSASVPNSYAGAAKAPCTVPFNSTLPSTSKTPEDRGTKEKEKLVEKVKEKENVRSKPATESLSRSHERGRELHMNGRIEIVAITICMSVRTTRTAMDRL
mgnify:CR=1 FL=1